MATLLHNVKKIRLEEGTTNCILKMTSLDIKKKIKQFSARNELHLLEELLSDPTYQPEILSYVKKALGASEMDAIISLLANCQKCKLHNLHFLIFQEVFRHIIYNKSGDNSMKKINNCIDEFSIEELATLCDQALEEITLAASNSSSLNADWLLCCSKIITIVGDHGEVIAENCRGHEYKSKIVKALCASAWKGKDVPLLASLMRDVSLKSTTNIIIEKICNYFSLLSPEEMPSLTHNLLGLSKLNGSDNLLILNSLQNYYFDAFQKMGEKSVRMVDYHLSQGTIILHIIHAIKIGHPIIKVILQQLRSNDPDLILESFTLFLSLSLTSIKHFKHQVIEYLKETIIKSLLQSEAIHKNAWIRTIMNGRQPDLYALLSNLIRQTVQSGGWDLIGQGILELAIALLDISMMKCPDVLKKIWDLSSNVLVVLISNSPNSSISVIHELTNRITYYQGFYQYTFCLHEVIKEECELLLNDTSIFLQLFDRIPSMEITTASCVLKAILPLVKYSRSVCDNIIMIFRKALFSSSTQSRKIAIIGVLQLLKYFRVQTGIPTTHLSQSSGSLMTQFAIEVHAGARSSNDFICMELLNVLKRGFFQHASVRLVIYEEMYEVVCQNPEVCFPCLDILYQHSIKYNLKEGHIDLTKIVDKEEIIEPIGWYLYCVQSMIVKGKEISTNSDWELEFDSLNRLNELLDKLTQYYSSLDLTSLERSITGFLYIENLKNVYEVLLDHIILNGIDKSSNVSLLLQLYERHNDLSKLSKRASEKQNKNTKKENVLDRQSLPEYAITLKAISILIKVVLIDTDQFSFTNLRNDTAFLHWMFHILKEKLDTVQTPAGIHHDNSYFLLKQLKGLARTLYQNCVETVTYGKEIHLSSECLFIVFAMVKNMFFKKIHNFLSKLDSDIFEMTKKIIRKISLIHDLLSQDENSEESSVINTYFKFLLYIIDNQPNIDEKILNYIGEWVKNFSQTCRVNGMQFNSVLELLFNVDCRIKTNSNLFLEISRDIYIKMGDDNMNGEGKYSCITKESCETVFQVLFPCLESSLESCNVVINKCHNLMKWSKLSNSTNEFLYSIEASVCQLLARVVNAIGELARSSFPTTILCCDFILKFLINLYAIGAKLTQYFFVRCRQCKESVLTSRFDKLVKVISSNLTANVYSLISYVEQYQKDKTKKSTVIKQAKLIPQLIFKIAKFEKELIRLIPKCQIDLVQQCKLSTARDFRFNCEALNVSNETEENKDQSMSEAE